jgi:hypothetical protein
MDQEESMKNEDDDHDLRSSLAHMASPRTLASGRPIFLPNGSVLLAPGLSYTCAGCLWQTGVVQTFSVGNYAKHLEQCPHVQKYYSDSGDRPQYKQQAPQQQQQRPSKEEQGHNRYAKNAATAATRPPAATTGTATAPSPQPPTALRTNQEQQVHLAKTTAAATTMTKKKQVTLTTFTTSAIFATAVAHPRRRSGSSQKAAPASSITPSIMKTVRAVAFFPMATNEPFPFNHY